LALNNSPKLKGGTKMTLKNELQTFEEEFLIKEIENAA